MRSDGVDPRRAASYAPILVTDGIRAAAQRTPKRLALIDGDRSLTFRDLLGRQNRLANAVSCHFGLRHGDRAAVMAPNCLEFVEVLCGIASAGAVATLVNPRLTPRELEHICNDSEARILFVHSSLSEIAESADLATVERIVTIADREYEEWLGRARPTPPNARVDEFDPFAIIYTSGTTGRPKGVVLSHRSRVLTFFAMASEYGCYTDQDRSLTVTPMHHGAGLGRTLAALFFGGLCHIQDSFDPERVLRTVSDQAVTALFLVPTQFKAILSLGDSEHRRYQRTSLRALISSGAALSESTRGEMIAKLGEGILHASYGSTEASLVSNLRPGDQSRKPASVGLPFFCTDLVLLNSDGQPVDPGEPGELYTRSPYHFTEYYGQPALTEGAFRDSLCFTGDVARRDDEGYLYIAGRKDDTIISGGVNIDPLEIEGVISRHPAVDDVGVAAVPHDHWGQAVSAFVVLSRGEEVTEKELLDHCNEHLARFKLPKEIRFVEALPHNDSGKLVRQELAGISLTASARDPSCAESDERI